MAQLCPRNPWTNLPGVKHRFYRGFGFGAGCRGYRVRKIDRRNAGNKKHLHTISKGKDTVEGTISDSHSNEYNHGKQEV